jgi:hypothetical protein
VLKDEVLNFIQSEDEGAEDWSAQHIQPGSDGSATGSNGMLMPSDVAGVSDGHTVSENVAGDDCPARDIQPVSDGSDTGSNGVSMPGNQAGVDDGRTYSRNGTGSDGVGALERISPLDMLRQAFENDRRQREQATKRRYVFCVVQEPTLPTIDEADEELEEFEWPEECF